MQESLDIFISYAHQDEEHRKALEAQLSALRRAGLITIWNDRDISAGMEWKHEIDVHLNTAHVILLLVSPDFIASDYCYSIEMKRAIERYEQQEAHVIPIILRPVYFQETPFGELQALPTDAVPVVSSKWDSPDDAWYDVAEGIRRVIQKRLSSQWVNIGIAHYTHSRYEEALSAFRQALHLCSNDTKIYYFEGYVLCQLQRYEEALTSYDQIISLQPSDTLAYVNKGHILSKVKRVKEALTAFEQATRLEPDNADIYIAIGHTRLRGLFSVPGGIPGALEAFNQAIKIDPDDGYAYYYKSLLLKTGAVPKYDEALAAIELALRLGSRRKNSDYNNAYGYHLKGEILCHLERYEKALIALEQAIRLAPNDASYYYDKGNILLHHLKHFGEAVTAYEQAVRLISGEANAQNERELEIYRNALALAAAEQMVQLRPNDAHTYIEKGHALRNMSGIENYMGGTRNNEEALVSYDQATLLEPNNTIAHFFKGRLLLGFGRYEEAVEAFEDALRLDPIHLNNTCAIYESKGEALSALGRHDEALTAYEEALCINSEAVSILHSKGHSLAELKRHNESLAAYEQIVRLAPDWFVGHRAVGLTLESLERYEEALEAYERALRLLGHDLFGFIHYRKAEILRRLGRVEDSQQAYRKARELDSLRRTNGWSFFE